MLFVKVEVVYRKWDIKNGRAFVKFVFENCYFKPKSDLFHFKYLPLAKSDVMLMKL